jgi:cytochrome c1
VIEPLQRRNAGGTEAVDGVLDIGGEHADGIERQPDRGISAKGRNQQADGAGDFAEAGQKDDGFGLRHPGRRDRQEWFRNGDVEDAGDAVEHGQQDTAAGATIGPRTYMERTKPQLNQRFSKGNER